MSRKSLNCLKPPKGKDETDGECYSKPQKTDPLKKSNLRYSSSNQNLMVLQGPSIASKYYPMNHKRRGKALIFNFIEFKNDTRRRGAEIDTERMKNAFELLAFDVQVYLNLTKESVSDIIQKVAREDHSDADCIAVVMMSHGEEGKIKTSDGRQLKTQNVWKRFLPHNSPTLATKPKLFFIQACRGKKHDRAVSVLLTAETDDNSDVIPRGTYAIPARADFLISHATNEGFYATRHPENGSWYIEALSKELTENGSRYDLLQILTNVNKRVAIFYSIDQDKKQMPSFTSTLTRMVYFGEKRDVQRRETIL